MVREAAIEKYLNQRVKECGGETRKVKWIGRDHAPDRRVMLPWVRVWVELKATGEKLRPGQEREHRRMAALGEYVIVIDSFEGVDNLCRR